MAENDLLSLTVVDLKQLCSMKSLNAGKLKKKELVQLLLDSGVDSVEISGLVTKTGSRKSILTPRKSLHESELTMSTRSRRTRTYIEHVEEENQTSDDINAEDKENEKAKPKRSSRRKSELSKDGSVTPAKQSKSPAAKGAKKSAEAVDQTVLDEPDQDEESENSKPEESFVSASAETPKKLFIEEDDNRSKVRESSSSRKSKSKRSVRKRKQTEKGVRRKRISEERDNEESMEQQELSIDKEQATDHDESLSDEPEEVDDEKIVKEAEQSSEDNQVEHSDKSDESIENRDDVGDACEQKEDDEIKNESKSMQEEDDENEKKVENEEIDKTLEEKSDKVVEKESKEKSEKKEPSDMVSENTENMDEKLKEGADVEQQKELTGDETMETDVRETNQTTPKANPSANRKQWSPPDSMEYAHDSDPSTPEKVPLETDPDSTDEPTLSRQTTFTIESRTPIVKAKQTPGVSSASKVTFKASKTPNFKALHAKEQARMESIIEHSARKRDRMRKLVSATREIREAGNASREAKTPKTPMRNIKGTPSSAMTPGSTKKILSDKVRSNRRFELMMKSRGLPMPEEQEDEDKK